MITPGHFYLVISMRRAVEAGKQLGRPNGTSLDVEAIHRLRSEGLSLMQIARALNSSKSSVARLLNTVP